MIKSTLAAAAIFAAAAVNAPAIAQAPHGVEMMTTRHAVFISTDMPHCHYEDGSGGPRPCTWNLGKGIDGNGIGLSYWVGKGMKVHYLWPSSPLAGHPHREWVPRSMSHTWDFHRPRWWRRCFINTNTKAVHCPNGDSYSTD